MEQVQRPGDIVASAVADEDGVATVRIQFGKEVDERGKELERYICNALAQPKESKIRKLGRLVQCFPGVVLCHRRVAEFLDDLWERGEYVAVKRIVGEPHRGRPHESHYPEIAMIDRLLAKGYPSIAAAARDLCKLGVFKHPPSVQNNYSRYKKDYDVWNKGYRVALGNFQSSPWSSPARPK